MSSSILHGDAKLFRAISAPVSPQIRWKVRKDGDPKRTQEILQIGQQKLPIE